MASEAKVRIRVDDRTRAGTASALNNLNSLQRSATNLTKAFAAVAGAYGIGRVIKSSIDLGDHINDLNRQYGISTEFLSRMNTVAKMNGTTMDAVANSVKFLQKNAYEAVGGNKELIESFQRLNIDVNDFIKLSADDQFLLMTDRISSIGNMSERTALSLKVMGKSGNEMLKVMDQGSDSIREAWKESDKLGTTISKLEAEKMDQMNDQLVVLQQQLSGYATQLSLKVIPFTIYWADALGLVNRQISSLDVGEVGVEIEDLTKKYAALDVEIMNRTGWDTPGNDEYIKEITKERDAVAVELTALIKRRREIEKEMFGGEKLEFVTVDAQKRTTDPAIIKAIEERNKKREEEYKKTEQLMLDAADAEQAHMDKLNDEGKAIYQETRTEMELYNAEIAKMIDLRDRGIITQETFMRKFEQMTPQVTAQKREVEKVNEAAVELGLTFTSAFEDAIVEGESFGSVLKSLEKDLIRMAARKLITQPLLEGLTAGISGMMGGGWGAIATALTGAVSGAPEPRAKGGPVEPGKPYLVGEKGPELRTFARGGSIVPNDALGGGTTVNVTINATDTNLIPAIKLMVQNEMVPGIVAAAKKDTISTLNRKGFA